MGALRAPRVKLRAQLGHAVFIPYPVIGHPECICDRLVERGLGQFPRFAFVTARFHDQTARRQREGFAPLGQRIDEMHEGKGGSHDKNGLAKVRRHFHRIDKGAGHQAIGVPKEKRPTRSKLRRPRVEHVRQGGMRGHLRGRGENGKIPRRHLRECAVVTLQAGDFVKLKRVEVMFARSLRGGSAGVKNFHRLVHRESGEGEFLESNLRHSGDVLPPRNLPGGFAQGIAVTAVGQIVRVLVGENLLGQRMKFFLREGFTLDGGNNLGIERIHGAFFRAGVRRQLSDMIKADRSPRCQWASAGPEPRLPIRKAFRVFPRRNNAVSRWR